MPTYGTQVVHPRNEIDKNAYPLVEVRLLDEQGEVVQGPVVFHDYSDPEKIMGRVGVEAFTIATRAMLHARQAVADLIHV
jgi:hypothetical protein